MVMPCICLYCFHLLPTIKELFIISSQKKSLPHHMIQIVLLREFSIITRFTQIKECFVLINARVEINSFSFNPIGKLSKMLWVVPP